MSSLCPNQFLESFLLSTSPAVARLLLSQFPFLVDALFHLQAHHYCKERYFKSSDNKTWIIFWREMENFNVNSAFSEGILNTRLRKLDLSAAECHGSEITNESDTYLSHIETNIQFNHGLSWYSMDKFRGSVNLGCRIGLEESVEELWEKRSMKDRHSTWAASHMVGVKAELLTESLSRLDRLLGQVATGVRLVKGVK